MSLSRVGDDQEIFASVEPAKKYPTCVGDVPKLFGISKEHQCWKMSLAPDLVVNSKTVPRSP
jgi:hypothetical protein